MDAIISFLFGIVIFLIVLLLYYQKTRFDRLQNKRNKFEGEIKNLKNSLEYLRLDKKFCESSRIWLSDQMREMEHLNMENTRDISEVRRYGRK